MSKWRALGKAAVVVVVAQALMVAAALCLQQSPGTLEAAMASVTIELGALVFVWAL
jgi:hypothetical protein